MHGAAVMTGEIRLHNMSLTFVGKAVRIWSKSENLPVSHLTVRVCYARIFQSRYYFGSDELYAAVNG